MGAAVTIGAVDTVVAVLANMAWVFYIDTRAETNKRAGWRTAAAAAAAGHPPVQGCAAWPWALCDGGERQPSSRRVQRNQACAAGRMASYKLHSLVGLHTHHTAPLSPRSTLLWPATRQSHIEKDPIIQGIIVSCRSGDIAPLPCP